MAQRESAGFRYKARVLVYDSRKGLGFCENDKTAKGRLPVAAALHIRPQSHLGFLDLVVYMAV